MSRGLPSKCLSSEQWEAYLHPLAVENDQWQEHLEHCPACRETLDGLAGDPTWWQEAEQWLGPQSEPRLEEFVTRVTESVCAMSLVGGDDDQHNPLCEFEIKQLQHMLAPASHPELLGRIGRYELEQLVGRGGMGLVFRARDIELHRIVAVKVLAVHLIPIAAARERFIREARASAALVHPHIVPVYDVITDEPIPALVMQFVAGPTLEAWLRTHGTLEWKRVLQIAIQLADALAAAHASGLVHRDVKPGNVLLEADGARALLSDFGLVRTLEEATLTRSGMLAGTPDYMSPEQARGEAVLTSSDLFSLGSVLYAMLTGHPPFRANEPMAVMNRICHERHRSLVSTHPEIPLEVSRMVDKLLAKEPRRRFHSAEELRQHLQELAQAPLRLRRAGTQSTATRWLTMVAGAMLLGSALALLMHNWDGSRPLPVDDVRGQFEGRRTLSEPSAATNGFADLRALDDSLSALDIQVDKLWEEFVAPDTRRDSPISSPAQAVDGQMDDIQSALTELEMELELSPVRWGNQTKR